MNLTSLLKIDMELIHGMPTQGNDVVDLQRERILHQNGKKLRQIEERMLTGKEIQVSVKSIDEVVQRVLYYTVHKDKTPDFTASELRIISYYLSKLQGNDEAFNFAVRLLDNNWRELFINGLVFYVLNSWNQIRGDYKAIVCELLQRRLIEYSGNIKRYQALGNHADYFEENGPIRLAALLNQRNETLENAPIILGYKPSTISWSFYSDVIIKNVLTKGISNESEVETILNKHNLDRTRKLVFANLIIKAEKNASSEEQMRLGRFASRIIGDVSLASTWAPFTGATSEDVYKLRRAKELVNLWYSRIIIEVFFEVCCQDKSRQKFWLKYVNDVEDFRVAGSTMVRNNLRNDPRSRDMYTRFFVETSSEVAQTSALILCIKDKVFVEFSDTGALHIYKHGRSQLKSIQQGRKYIDKVEDLKTKDIPLLVETNGGYYYLNEEGRLHHRGEWEGRLRRWMEHYMSSSNTSRMSFSKGVDDKVFAAKPIEDKAPVLRQDFDPEKETVSDSPQKPKTSATPSLNNHPDTRAHRHTEEKHLFSELPEFENSDYKVEMSSAIQDNEDNIPMASKWIAEDRCRVIAKRTGYYYIQFKSGKVVKLVDMASEEPIRGSIWIKRPRTDGWRQIIHEYENQRFSIGYIKEFSKFVMFKRKENISKIKQFQFE